MADRPDILLIFTDTQRHDTVAALGNPVIRTPQLDRLVREGTAFTRAYTPSPVCIPARCSLHYGRYPQATGCYRNGPWPADDGRSWTQRLVDGGYRTHAIGKLHFPTPADRRGFMSREVQEELVHDPAEDDYLRFLRGRGFAHVTDPHGVRGEMYYIPQVAQMPAELHPTRWVGDRAVDFIAAQTSATQPSALMVNFIHPHPPFSPPAPWHKLYRGPDMPLPLVPDDHASHHTHANRVQNRYKYRDAGSDLHLLRQIKAYYYACISFVDAQIGRILAALESAGRLDRTLVLFTSDHGEHLGDYRCFGKRSMHDSSTRVPLLARLPGVFPAGRACDDVVSLVDVAPTICGLAGAVADGFDGLPLHQVAAGAHAREFVFAQHEQAGTAEYLAVSRAWSFFRSAPDGREYAYDQQRNPRQQRLAAGGPFHGATLARLRKELLAFLHARGETAAVEEQGGVLGWRSYPRLALPENPDDGLIVQDHRWAEQRIPGYSADR